MSIIHDHLAFEECLFVHVSVIIVFALHYMFINYRALIIKESIYISLGEIYIVITDIYNLLYCYKDLIDLYYKLSEFHVTFDHINTSI